MCTVKVLKRACRHPPRTLSCSPHPPATLRARLSLTHLVQLHLQSLLLFPLHSNFLILFGYSMFFLISSLSLGEGSRSLESKEVIQKHIRVDLDHEFWG